MRKRAPFSDRAAIGVYRVRGVGKVQICDAQLGGWCNGCWSRTQVQQSAGEPQFVRSVVLSEFGWLSELALEWGSGQTAFQKKTGALR